MPFNRINLLFSNKPFSVSLCLCGKSHLRKQIQLALLLLSLFLNTEAQNPKSYTSSEILAQIKKLNVLGSVLYIAAHPDDENNTLLPYLANEKLYRTAYLSLTRGEGGQNLIGDEQGIDLGLIRTQELIAARKIDGAEQYFSRAYEFGYSKTAEEALRIWNKEKILADVVWVIRQYQPDVIIKRFPPDGRAGHGHHAASAIIADEAFIAAADPERFPEQFNYGVKPWKAKRILWNTYNFGGTNTTSNDQLKIDIGGFNPIFGKSYGEMGAQARSMHKSQGEGRPGRRGEIIDFFSVTGGEAAKNTLMDGVNINWSRINGTDGITDSIDNIIQHFQADHPELSIPSLSALYTTIEKLPAGVWRNKKLADIQQSIEACSGIYMEAVAQTQFNVIGDSAKFNINFINRTGVPISKVEVSLFGNSYVFENIKMNENNNKNITVMISKEQKATQPYWLEQPLQAGAFDVAVQEFAGMPENEAYVALFKISSGNALYSYQKKILYKFTDPVKGELYQPIQIVNPVSINCTPSIIIFPNNAKNKTRLLQYTVQSNTTLNEKVQFKTVYGQREMQIFDSLINYPKGSTVTIDVKVNSDSIQPNSSLYMGGELTAASLFRKQSLSLRKISYDHIPDLFYNYHDQSKIIKMDLKIKGKLIGYVMGAGDKVPEALEAMGYDVRYLTEADLTEDNLKKFDAIITGIRAYNISEWLIKKNELLKRYVEQGGNMIVQYVKSSGQRKVVAGPYPFTIESGSRVTEEDAPVTFLLPQHPALNIPNKITEKDFEGWVQERSTYQAVNTDPHFEMLLGMHDKGENQTNGSLAIARFGKGNFVYASLAFFRQLPAGVPGSFRLMANLIALPKMR